MGDNKRTIDPLIRQRINERVKETSLLKFGETSWTKTEIGKKRMQKSTREYLLLKYKTLDNFFKRCNVKLVDTDYINALTDHMWECLSCQTQFNTKWFYIQQGKKCPGCFPKSLTNGKSKQEKEIFDFIKSITNHDIIEHEKDIIKPKELDIYIPDLKLAIEYNGLYFHSTKFIKDKNYHISKTIDCLKKDIKLIQIFEDEWINKKEITKSRIKNQLGLCDERIHARKCLIKEIDFKTKNRFLIENHIQGSDVSFIKLGAFYNDKLVSVMTFSHPSIAKGGNPQNKDVWELSRFVIKLNTKIPGIASKLLSFFKKNYQWKNIFSYADRRWSDGNLYLKLGFVFLYNTQPNYWYVNGSKRIHRFNLRKRPDEPRNVTESVLRANEGYNVIYDCGNIKFNFVNEFYVESQKPIFDDISKEDIEFIDDNLVKPKHKRKGVPPGFISKLKNRSFNEIFGEEKSEIIKEKKRRKLVQKFLDEKFDDIQKKLNIKIVDINTFEKVTTPNSYQCLSCDNIMNVSLWELQNRKKCPTCFPPKKK